MQHIQVIRKVFKERGLIDPIIFLHNHDFNGRVSHDLLDVIKRVNKRITSHLLWLMQIREKVGHMPIIP